MESEAGHPIVYMEEGALETSGALQERNVDRHLAIGCHRQPKKRKQGDSGSRKKLAASRIGMTHRDIPAPRKGQGHQGPGSRQQLEHRSCRISIVENCYQAATTEENVTPEKLSGCFVHLWIVESINGAVITYA
jgi:hypothetical protein